MQSGSGANYNPEETQDALDDELERLSPSSKMNY